MRRASVASPLGQAAKDLLSARQPTASHLSTFVAQATFFTAAGLLELTCPGPSGTTFLYTDTKPRLCCSYYRFVDSQPTSPTSALRFPCDTCGAVLSHQFRDA